jgi:hypothetical protein
MRGGKEKEHARQPQLAVSDERPADLGSMSAVPPTTGNVNVVLPDFSDSSNTQPTGPNDQSGFSAETPTESSSGSYQEVLVDCDSLVGRYRKGRSRRRLPTATSNQNLRKRLEMTARSDAAFGSFIATIESHDSEVGEARDRGGRAEFNPYRRSPSPPGSDSDGNKSDGEPASKKIKVDESAYAWVASRKEKRTVLRDSLAKTLKLIEAYTIDPKATKRSLINEPDCPEFPDSEWKNVITGRAVNLDAVLSGQLSTTQDDYKVEKVGDLEISFGAVEPTKVVKNGGDWTIAWNKTVRATTFGFPHRVHELSSYGEYIVNLFSVTHPSVHSRVVAFDKAVRKRVGNVRNLELTDFEKFADLKIAHMDSIGVSVVSGTSKDKGDQKGKRGKNWKKDEPCNNWNDGKCSQAEEDCRRRHVCNRCGKGGHKGKECRSA